MEPEYTNTESHQLEACIITLARGAMQICPCPEILRTKLTFSMPFQARGRILRKNHPLWVSLDDGSGVGCSRTLLRQVRSILEENQLPYRIEDRSPVTLPTINRSQLPGLSDRHFEAIEAIRGIVDTGGCILLHPETEDLSPILAALITLFNHHRTVICVPNKAKKAAILHEVNRHLINPQVRLQPLDDDSMTAPQHAVIHEAELLLPEPEEVDVFIMLHADHLSGLKLQGNTIRFYQSLKLGFTSSTTNSFGSKIPLMESLLGPITPGILA